MRALACAAAFVLLLMVGFLATPSLFRILNPEYQLASYQYKDSLAKLANDILDISNKLAEADLEIGSLESSVKRETIDNTARQAQASARSDAPADIAKMAIEAGSKIEKLKVDLEQAKSKKARLEDQKASLDRAREQMTKEIGASAPESTHLYLVARALALGAIGALISFLVKFASSSTGRGLFEDPHSLARLWASTAIGAIVGVASLGLLLTKQISGFLQDSAGNPDFWSVTASCLLAGAFSESLYQMAASRVSGYLGVTEKRLRVTAKRPRKARVTARGKRSARQKQTPLPRNPA